MTPRRHRHSPRPQSEQGSPGPAESSTPAANFTYEEHLRAIHYVAQNPNVFRAMVKEMRGKAPAAGPSGLHPSNSPQRRKLIVHSNSARVLS